MNHHKLSAEQISSYQNDGYLIIREFFLKAEIDRLYNEALQDNNMRKNAIEVDDQSGKKSKLSLWYKPGNDIFSYLARSSRMVDCAGQLLESHSPVCHFHSKLMQKEPRVGGAWEWHQDYGYWYKNQFMFPDQLISVMIAFTKANKENGCLQVIKGSHKLGRVNHGFAGEQVGADMVMVENALRTMELIYVILEPGDALFFHSNLVHRSEANLSEDPRWSMISCYSSQSNLAYNEPSSSWKIPVDVVPEDAILNWKTDTSAVSHDFLKKENDRALKETGWESDVQIL
jgi:ectoine hydroxylase-related dioxygenase (phytanoyl-CoA dioxygenase family)